MRFAGFAAVEVRGRQVLIKAPVWTSPRPVIPGALPKMASQREATTCRWSMTWLLFFAHIPRRTSAMYNVMG